MVDIPQCFLSEILEIIFSFALIELALQTKK